MLEISIGLTQKDNDRKEYVFIYALQSKFYPKSKYLSYKDKYLAIIQIIAYFFLYKYNQYFFTCDKSSTTKIVERI